VFPDRAAKFAEDKGAHVVALNCGTGMDMPGAAKVAAIYKKSCGLPVMVQPNAGLPVLEGGKAVYKAIGGGHGGRCAGGFGGGRGHHRLLLRQHAGAHAGHRAGPARV
jgi:hypothetical protein